MQSAYDIFSAEHRSDKMHCMVRADENRGEGRWLVRLDPCQDTRISLVVLPGRSGVHRLAAPPPCRSDIRQSLVHA